MRLANYFITYFQDVESGKATPESTKKLKNTLTSFYKDYEGELDAKVTAKLLALYVQKTPADFLPSGFAQFSDVNKTLQ